MALSNDRITPGAETEHSHERKAIDFVLENLPNLDPFQAWPLHELHDSANRLYEIDLLILGRRALYLIEIKSWPGRVSGDIRDWRIEHQGKQRTIENPYALANRKAKVLGNLLRRRLSYPDDQIWVEPLVYLSHQQIDVQPMDESGRSHVVTRGNIMRALTHGEYPGAPVESRRPPVNRRQMMAVKEAMATLGLRPSRAFKRVGEFLLESLLAEGPGYQEHWAVHHSSPDTFRRRVRSYLVPRAPEPEERSRLERAAHREAEVLESLGEHPCILSYKTYVEGAPLGPALVFEPFEEGLPLDMLLRLQPDLSFDERMAILQRVAEALSFCHGRGVLHRNLSPSAVLVRKDGAQIQVKLHRFHLAAHEEGTRGTLHLAALSDEMDLIYRAPEVLDDPSSALPSSDVFSLGALACFLFTGQHPATSIVAREKQLREDGALSIQTLTDDFSAGFNELIHLATAYHAVERADDPVEWFALLEDEVTRPEAPEPVPEIDPSRAQAGDELPGGFVVVRTLGSGTTARVFHVRKDDRHYALKVPHDEDDCTDRLRAEAAVLGKLAHQHIVKAHGMYAVGRRQCLLMDLAAPREWRVRKETDEPRTLAELIRQQGPVGLDYARRFGDDLLSAVQYLEEQGYQHRDIKPSNIGFTPSQKRARHIVLLDFSLTSVDPSQIMAGTPGYRDPGLRLRGQWDAAADRFGAGVTLYEMLVGLRPELEPSMLPRGEEQPLLHAERFDASVRDRLVDFFRKTLHPSQDKRFATAEEMRYAWLNALPVEAPRVVTAEEPHEEIAPQETDADGAARPRSLFEGVTAITPVEALSISAAAKSTLDRAGVVTVGELTQLPRNVLSAIRGVGHRVAREIQVVAEVARRKGLEPETVAPLVPDYRGPLLEVQSGPPLGLSARSAMTLRGAGIGTTVELARASAERVGRLLDAKDVESLRRALQELSTGEAPVTLEDWTALFMPASIEGRSREALRGLLGLEPLRGVPAGDCVSVAQVAKLLDLSRAMVDAALHTARTEWRQVTQLDELMAQCEDVVTSLGDICSFASASTELSRRLTSGTTTTGEPSEESLRSAAALLRVVSELRDESGEAESMNLRKIRGTYFLTVSDELIDLTRQLGGVADRLASRQPLPSTAQVQKILARAVVQTPLAALPHERLVVLAAAASDTAHASPRLEIYPREMDPVRALDLSAAILSSGEIEPDAVHRLIRTRYPAAAALPDRPELDRLLEPYGLRFDESRVVYRRPDAPPAHEVTSATRMFLTVLSSAQSDEPLLDTPDANKARAFHDALRAAAERGRFRVLSVRADLADQATLHLAHELRVEPIQLDTRLIEHIERLRQEDEVDPSAIKDADRLGPGCEEWELLSQLVQAAADRMVVELLEHRDRPLLLTAPGLLQRFGLEEQLKTLIQRAEAEEGSAVLLLVPTHDTERPPTINNSMVVPVRAGQRLKVPRSWLENAHRAAA